MKLAKAIEIAECYIPDPDSVAVTDSIDAFQLLIEAGKRVQKKRTGYETYAPDLLPGETPPDTSDTPTRKFYVDKRTGAILPKPPNAEPTPPTMSFYPRTPATKPSDANPGSTALQTLDDSRQISRKSRSLPPKRQKPFQFNPRNYSTPPESQNKGIEQ